MAPASRGAVFADGWDAGVLAMSEALVGIADRGWERRGGRSSGAAELAVHMADVRECERAGLERLGAFVRKAVLPRTYLYSMERRRVLEALGESDRLCNARAIEYSTGDVILCTREAGHYDALGEDLSGWHKCNLRTWVDDRPYNRPHTAA